MDMDACSKGNRLARHLQACFVVLHRTAAPPPRTFPHASGIFCGPVTGLFGKDLGSFPAGTQVTARFSRGCARPTLESEDVMKTYNGAEAVKGGYYLNVGEWKLEAVNGASGTLAGGVEARYVRLPMLALLVVAPVLGMGLVLLLPFFGLAVLGEGLWTKARTVLAARRAPVRPTTVRR
jgi:hypothetical protein